ncbi:MAG: hypothetical protein IT427_01465 [Pirellulales bacterium]|nr:hypothetical protein [Pirellulales bacterium]
MIDMRFGQFDRLTAIGLTQMAPATTHERMGTEAGGGDDCYSKAHHDQIQFSLGIIVQFYRRCQEIFDKSDKVVIPVKPIF